MEDRRVIKILINLKEEYPLGVDDKGAISYAIGILSWSTLTETKIKGLGTRGKEDNL